MIKPNYILIPLFVLVIAVLGNIITAQGLDWYSRLNLPLITPPGFIIGIIWSVIFILTTISALIFYNRAFRNLRFIFVITLFLINGALNLLWSYLFFNLHLVGASIVEMLFLEATVIALIFLIRFSSKKASVLLYPYAIWVIFATFLAYQILLLNT